MLGGGGGGGGAKAVKSELGSHSPLFLPSMRVNSALLTIVAIPPVDFSCVWTFRVAFTGNVCFGKCGVIHYSLWGIQTISFRYTQHRMSTVAPYPHPRRRAAVKEVIPRLPMPGYWRVVSQMILAPITWPRTSSVSRSTCAGTVSLQGNALLCRIIQRYSIHVYGGIVVVVCMYVRWPFTRLLILGVCLAS